MTLYDEALAEQYEAWFRTPRGRLYDRLEWAALRRALPPGRRGRRLLEVGCGTGWWLRRFAGEDRLLVGLDPSRPMLARAAQKQIPTAHLLAGRGEELPFPAGSFDSAVAVTALLAVESPAAVLAQMRRVLRPGGTLLLGVLNRRGPLNRRRARSGGGTFDEARFLTREELEELLEGMDEVRIRATTFVPDHPFFFRLGLLLEPLGRLLGWRWGELLVATARAR